MKHTETPTKKTKIDYQEIGECLSSAADLIKENDWTNGYKAKNKNMDLCSPQSPLATRFCPIGAIERISHKMTIKTKYPYTHGASKTAVEESNHFWRLYRNARLYFGSFLRGKKGAYNYLIWPWNDAPGRTKQEVIDALEEASKKALGGITYDEDAAVVPD